MPLLADAKQVDLICSRRVCSSHLGRSGQVSSDLMMTARTWMMTRRMALAWAEGYREGTDVLAKLLSRLLCCIRAPTALEFNF
eukprot:3497415-Amphidinium_carterae.1